MTAVVSPEPKAELNAVEAFDPFNPPPPDEADERARLARALNLTDRFALFVATCNRADVRQEIVAEIKAENPSLRLVEVTVDRTVPNLLAFLSSLPDVRDADAVFVSGLESFLPNTEEVEHSAFVVNLNGTRDAFPNTLSCPLVLWLADYARNGLMRGAPDFYSIRSASFVFATPVPNALVIENLITNSEYLSSWDMSFQKREVRIKELNDLLTQLQSLPDKEQDILTILTVSNRLAGLYAAYAQYDRAEPLFCYILSVSEKVFGKEHPNTLVCLGNVASLYSKTDRNEEAEKLVVNALTLASKSDAAKDTVTTIASLKYKLANVYRNQNKITQAEEMLKDALSDIDRSCSEENVGKVIILNNLASIYLTQNKLAFSSPLLTRALKISRDYLGPNHPITASIITNIGEINFRKGNLIEGERFLLEGLRLQQFALGLEHPEVAKTTYSIASVYEGGGRLQDAILYYKQAETINEKVFGVNHSFTMEARRKGLKITKLIEVREAFQPMSIKPNIKKLTSKKAK